MQKPNTYQKLFTLYFVLLIPLWIVINVNGVKTSNFNFLYSFLFGLIPFFGGIIGMVRSSIWGRFKSTIGKAVFFISLGLFWWGFGENIWSYYNFFEHVPAPYPSLADIGFAQSIFFWVIGTIYLAKASGATLALKRSRSAKLIAVLAPVVLLVLSYYLLVQVARGGVLVPPDEPPLKVVLDIAYPLGDFLALSFAFVVFTLSRRYFGGIYKQAIVSILLGLSVMYFADFVFSYTTTSGAFYNGNWGDMLLTIGLFLITYGTLGFVTKPVTQVSDERQEAT